MRVKLAPQSTTWPCRSLQIKTWIPIDIRYIPTLSVATTGIIAGIIASLFLGRQRSFLLVCVIHCDVTRMPCLKSRKRQFFEILERRFTTEKQKPGTGRISSFILGKIRDSFCKVTIQFIIAYKLDNRKYTPPTKFRCPGPFLGPKRGPLFIVYAGRCMLQLFYRAEPARRRLVAFEVAIWPSSSLWFGGTRSLTGV